MNVTKSPEFFEFAQLCEATMGIELNQDWLLGKWAAADQDPNRALNYVMDAPPSELEQNTVTKAENDWGFFPSADPEPFNFVPQQVPPPQLSRPSTPRMAFPPSPPPLQTPAFQPPAPLPPPMPMPMPMEQQQIVPMPPAPPPVLPHPSASSSVLLPGGMDLPTMFMHQTITMNSMVMQQMMQQMQVQAMITQSMMMMHRPYQGRNAQNAKRWLNRQREMEQYSNQFYGADEDYWSEEEADFVPKTNNNPFAPRRRR